MIRSAREAAQDLVNALREADTAFTAQKERADSARESTESTQSQFMSLLEANRVNPGNEEAKQQNEEFRRGMTSRLFFERERDRPGVMSALSRRWEEALVDSQSAL